MSDFEVLLDKVAQRLAKNYKPHRATLNKLYAYPIDPAFREYRLKARVMELRDENDRGWEEALFAAYLHDEEYPVLDAKGSLWKYYKFPEPIELTQAELLQIAAEAKGVNAEQIKIKE